jgi:hypothetical protein
MNKFNDVISYNLKEFIDTLPFSLTTSQTRSILEIAEDLKKERPMNRLLEGDVGSGKTIVAFMCMLIAKDNDFQSCIMAPTEILAGQHYETIVGMLRDMPVKVRLLRGSTLTKERKVILKELLEGEKKLAKGGFSLNEAKDLAVKMKGVRDDIRDLISVRTSLDNHSAEGQADNARFNYLVSVCVVYNDTKQPYFKNLEDYLNKSTDQVAILGAQNLANMLYGLDNDYESNLPENKFLKKYRFIDDKLRLIDKKGRLIDGEGRLVDERGRFIDEEGGFVDKFGNRVDADGEYVVEQQPFLDDDGQPIIVDEQSNDNKPAEPAEEKSETSQQDSV